MSENANATPHTAAFVLGLRVRMRIIRAFTLSSQTAFYLVGGIIIFAKIALFCKCFTNFFGKIHGLVHLILYFCALEILPDLMAWKGIEIVSNNLTLNI